jgi:hypothetical protein
MNWFNLYTPTIRSDRFAGATDEQLGVWMRCMVYCCEQENGGAIHGASLWSERKWMAAIGISEQVIRDDSPLWHFNEIGSLILLDYPHAKEAEIKAKRRAGKRTAAMRWHKKETRKIQRLRSSATSSPTSLPNAEGEGEGEGEDKDTPGDAHVLRPNQRAPENHPQGSPNGLPIRSPNTRPITTL